MSWFGMTVVSVTFIPGMLANCDWERLDHSISKDVADDLISAQRKFGCYYDEVSCNFFDSRAVCSLGKSTIVRSKFSSYEQHALIHFCVYSSECKVWLVIKFLC